MRTELKRCIEIDRRWNKSEVSRMSSEDALTRRPTSHKKPKPDEFNDLWFSNATGWNIVWRKEGIFLIHDGSDFCSATRRMGRNMQEACLPLSHSMLEICRLAMGSMWMTKPLHGQFLRQTREVADSKSWACMMPGNVKKETKGFLTAAQDQALTTNAIKVKIDKQEGDVRCRTCNDREETVAHLTSDCINLAQLEYKKRHDKVARIVHWSLCEKHGLPCSRNNGTDIPLN